MDRLPFPLVHVGRGESHVRKLAELETALAELRQLVAAERTKIVDLPPLPMRPLN